MMMEEVKCKRQKVEDTLAKQSWSDKNKKHQVSKLFHPPQHGPETISRQLQCIWA